VPRAAATSPASRDINGDDRSERLLKLDLWWCYIYIYVCVWYRNDIWHNYLEIYADADVFEEYGVDVINWKRLQVGYNFTIWPANKYGYVGWFHHESTSLTVWVGDSTLVEIVPKCPDTSDWWVVLVQLEARAR
jgi:hypothetical protein